LVKKDDAAWKSHMARVWSVSHVLPAAIARAATLVSDYQFSTERTFIHITVLPSPQQFYVDSIWTPQGFCGLFMESIELSCKISIKGSLHNNQK
jgi:hypothetical protein